MLSRQTVFYRCGACGQVFWPGEKYESTTEGEGLRQDVQEPLQGSLAGFECRSPCGTVDGAPLSIGRQVRQGTLHSTQRMRLGVPEILSCQTRYKLATQYEIGVSKQSK